MLDCKQCLHKCKSECCAELPFDREFLDTHKPARTVVNEVVFGDKVISETEGHYCLYLDKDFRCSIYNERPEVCRLFGDESNINLICPYQDKGGRVRSRQERRAIERKLQKDLKRFLQRYGSK